MDGHLFIAQGDITQLAAHAIACSTSTGLAGKGSMFSSFRDNIPGFTEWFQGLGPGRAGRTHVGETFWMPLRPDARPHGVVAVVAAGRPASAEDKAATAARVAIDEAVARLRRDLKLEGRLLIALPAFRSGKGGDRDHQVRSARVQIAGARTALARHAGVDAAFIAYTPSLYRVFLEARRDLLGESSPAPSIPADLERALIGGECVLFAGAGLSRGAGLPDWDALIARMARELGLEAHEKLDHLDLAQWYREKFGRAGLARLIGEVFADPAFSPRPTLAHYLAMSLPANFVITTNYDDLLERTLSALKRYPVAVVAQEDIAGTGRADGVHVIKLHGDAACPDGVVLCRDDYDEFFERRPAMALLLEGLMLNRTFLFLGYGLRDPNFRQIFGRVGRMLRKAKRPAFATSFESAGDAGPFVAEQWRRRGLELIGLPGATDEERERMLLIWLDRLADRVASATARLPLAPDAQVTCHLVRLRTLLLEVGEEVGGLCMRAATGTLGDAEIGPVADILELLSNHSWRPTGPSGSTLSGLWEGLASAADDLTMRRRRLVAALRFAEGSDEASRVRESLARLEVPGSGPPTEDLATEADPPGY